MPTIGSSSFNLSSLFSGISKLGQHRADINQSLERLSTGKKINRGADDPSGLIASNKLQASQLSLQKRLTSFEHESASLGAQEGTLSVLSDLMIELDALTVTNANTGALSQEERDANTDQAKSIVNAINHIQSSATFKGVNILTGFGAADLASISIETTDPETGEPITVQKTLADLPQLLESDPEAAQEIAQLAATKVSNRRGAVGNRLNAIDSQSRALQAELEGTSDALSQILDTDYAVETAKLVRSQILEQATTQTILTQRKQVESMLNLLTTSTTNTSNAISAQAPASNRI
ncbi:MAG: flagellin [Phycisphaerales bacterium]